MITNKKTWTDEIERNVRVVLPRFVRFLQSQGFYTLGIDNGRVVTNGGEVFFFQVVPDWNSREKLGLDKNGDLDADAEQTWLDQIQDAYEEHEWRI
jgi:hypothetical protein